MDWRIVFSDMKENPGMFQILNSILIILDNPLLVLHLAHSIFFMAMTMAMSHEPLSFRIFQALCLLVGCVAQVEYGADIVSGKREQ